MAAPPRKTRPVPADTPRRHLEVETKLELADGIALPRLTGRKSLQAVGLPTAGPEIAYDLDATYYDTAGLDLLRSRLTLRRRTGGDDAGWHLKLPDAGRGRTEVTLPLGTPDDHQVPAALADLVRGTARGRALVPVARLQNHRVVRHLLDDAGRRCVEVADDRVTATSLGAAGPASQTWRELEAELVGGDAAQLAATVAVLRAAGATPAAGASKLGRALPLPARPTGLARKSAGAALLATLDRQRDALLTVDRRLRDADRSAVADGRRVQRRIRSVLRVFGSLFDVAVTDTVRSGLRDYGRELARVREIEVLRQRLHGQLGEEPEDYARHAGARLDAELDDRAARAWSELTDFLDTDGYFAMLRALDALLDGPAVTAQAHRAASSELPQLLDRSWRKLRALADAALVDPDHAPTVHETRKAAKTLRYAAEATVAAIGDNAVVLAAALEDIQEILGEHRDAILAAALLVELAGDARTDGIAGFIFGRLHAVEQALAHGAIDDFADAWDRVEDGDLVAALAR